VSDLRTPLPERTGRDYLRATVYFAVLTVFFGLLAVLGYKYLYPSRLGPLQPIPFSHRVHAHDKEISCLICHPGVMYGARADIPPLQTCMLCHSRIIITYPWIRLLRTHYFSGRPVYWKRVNYLPEYVYFDHSVHIYRRIDCGKCHGDVLRMDRIKIARPFEMGFCIGCHKDNGATHDCFTCHR